MRRGNWSLHAAPQGSGPTPGNSASAPSPHGFNRARPGSRRAQDRGRREGCRRRGRGRGGRKRSLRRWEEEECVPTGREGWRGGKRRESAAAAAAGVYLRAEVRALDAQFDAGGTLELGLAAAAVRLAYPCLHGRHAARLLEERFSEEEEEGGRPSRGGEEGRAGGGARPGGAGRGRKRLAGPALTTLRAPPPPRARSWRPAPRPKPPPPGRARTWGPRGNAAETTCSATTPAEFPRGVRPPGAGRRRPGEAGQERPTCLAPSVPKERYPVVPYRLNPSALYVPHVRRLLERALHSSVLVHLAAPWKMKVIPFFKFYCLLCTLRPKDHRSFTKKKREPESCL